VKAGVRRRARRGLWIGIPIFLAVCLPGLTNGIRNVVESIRDASTPEHTAPAPSQRPLPSLAYPAPSTVVEAQQAGAFDLPVGSGVQVTTGIDQWTVAVVDVAWLPGPCDDTFGDSGPVVVLALRYDVTGGQAVSVPPFEFRYEDSAGTQHSPSFTAGCESDPVSTVVADAGETSDAVVAFDIPDGSGGEVTYAPSQVDLASWTIPARPA